MGPIVAEVVPRPGHLVRALLLLALTVSAVAAIPHGHPARAAPATPSYREGATSIRAPIFRSHRCGMRRLQVQEAPAAP